MHLRPRSTTALVVSRSDTPVADRLGESGETPAGSGPDVLPGSPWQSHRRDRRWPTVLTWIVLSAAIAALWVLLLLGDSLPLSG